LSHVHNFSLNAFAIDRNLKTPRYHNFNVSIQRELFKNNVLTVGYSGQRGRDLIIYYDQNASPIGSSFVDLDTGLPRVCAKLLKN